MPDRNAEPVTIHHVHLSAKIRPVIRTAFEDVELPLMDHFMRQRTENGSMVRIPRALKEGSR
jgi:hypothetical protein